MPTLVSYKCPECGAAIAPPADASTYTCEFCKRPFTITRTVVPQPPFVSPPAPPPQLNIPQLLGVDPASVVAEVERGAKKVVRWVIWFVVIIVLVTVLLPLLFSALAMHKAEKLTTNLKQAIADRATRVIRDDFLWDDVAPTLAVKAGARELIVGRIRSRTQSHDDQLYIVAHDAATLANLWKVGPLGTYSEAYRATWAAAGGGVVVMSDKKPQVRILDAATGQERALVPLSDTASALCVSEDGGEAWVEVIDHQSLLIDIASAHGKVTPRAPAWCHALGMTGFDHHAAPKIAPPHVTGYRVERTLGDGALGVALAVKSPGTPVPLIVGFDARTHAVTWQSPLVDDGGSVELERDAAGIAGGRAIVAYERRADSSHHLVAFDAATGKRAWDTALDIHGSLRDGLVVSATRVYLPGSKLIVLDAATGESKGSLGF